MRKYVNDSTERYDNLNYFGGQRSCWQTSVLENKGERLIIWSTSVLLRLMNGSAASSVTKYADRWTRSFRTRYVDILSEFIRNHGYHGARLRM